MYVLKAVFGYNFNAEFDIGEFGTNVSSSQVNWLIISPYKSCIFLVEK